MKPDEPIRIANCSGFYGDRLSAACEMVAGGDIDVLTGDWLAELTMGILHAQKARDPAAGYARTFLTQVEQVLLDCVESGVKIISNAGGANPTACADAVQQVAARLGISVSVAVVDGDDVTDLMAARIADGAAMTHLSTGEDLADRDTHLLAANAYLGAWGIVEALDAGADVVITGRVTDASIVVAPAAHRFGWGRTDWDKLAGAVVAGHVIECGAQATGGNLSFFAEVDDLRHVGFPIAEIAADGSSVITKHDGTAGTVGVDSVTAQLVYEIDGPRYANTDVVARLDTVDLTQLGPDCVQISGVRGEPAPPTLKVGLLVEGGWRNSVLLGMAGRNIEEKVALAEETIWDNIDGGRSAFDDVHVALVGHESDDPATMRDATCILSIAVRGRERRSVDAFGRAVVETGLASYPGLFLIAPPVKASSVTIFWPVAVDAADVPQRVSIADRSWTVTPLVPDKALAHEPPDAAPAASVTAVPVSAATPAALGERFGARSGDKGGNATLGVWARSDDEFAWLRSWWDADGLRRVVPEVDGLDVAKWTLPNLRAVGATVVGYLGDGVGANLRLDPQAKSLGEYVLAKKVTMPSTAETDS